MYQSRERLSTRGEELCPIHTNVGKSCQSREFLTCQTCLLTLFAKIKFSRKNPNLQYFDIFPGTIKAYYTMYNVNIDMSIIMIWHRLARTSASATSKSAVPWIVYVAVQTDD